MIRIDRHGYGRFTVPLSGTNFGLLLDHDHSDRVMLMGLPARSGWRAISSVCLSHQTYVKKAEEWLEGNKHARKIAVLEVDSGEWQTVWEGGWTDGVKADWLPTHGVGCVECRRPVPSGVVSHEPCSHCDDAADGLRADGGPEQADREQVRETAGEHTHGMFLSKRWNDRAEENVEKWGNQRHDTVLLALIEEVGEIAMAMESGNAPGGGPHPAVGPDSPESRGRDLIHEMASIGRETRQFLESEYPSPAGDGEGDSEFEVHGNPNSPEDAERIFEEIDDAAPLLFQLYWAVERCDVDTGGDA